MGLKGLRRRLEGSAAGVQPDLKCSFCGKRRSQVARLIAGPGVYICNECIALCVEIVGEELYDGDTGLHELAARLRPPPVTT